MFYWSRYRYHGNTAGSKPALNNGFDLFSENPVVRFFPSFVSRKLKNTGLLTLVSWNFDREIFCYFVFCILKFSEHVLCQISIFVCRRAKRVPNYYSTKFHEILTSGSVEITAFPLNSAVTIFWLTAHALHLTGFSIFLDPYKQSQKGRVFSKSITFNTLKNKRFWHVTNCLIVKTEKTLAIFTEQNEMIAVQAPIGATFVFLKALCARLFMSAVQVLWLHAHWWCEL